MYNKSALITGVTGQDGAYLARLLLEKDYKVYGLLRRTVNKSLENLEYLSISDKINYIDGDMTDEASLIKAIKDIQPDEVYNLAAQSFVGSSWIQATTTIEINALGTLKLLNAIKSNCPTAKFYQASSSEMFGNNSDNGTQFAHTAFKPRSPYGISKVTAHMLTVNYRESYGLFACCGILFNHESIPKNSPLIIKDKNGIDILPIEDMFKSEKHRYEGILKKYKDNLVWNGEDWTKIIAGSCYQNKEKNVKLIQTRESCYEATDNHIAFKEDNTEIKTSDFKLNDSVFKVKFPEVNNKLNNNLDFVKFLGFVVGDGSIDSRGRIRLIGTNKKELIEIYNLLKNNYNWSYRISTYGSGGYESSSKDVWQLDINNDIYFGRWLKNSIYTKHSKEKKVPKFILNANTDVKKAFFDGYYMADGRKKGNEQYKYKGFTTNSATLCLGLNIILKEITNQEIKTKCEYRNKKRYYYTQLNCGYKTNKGYHLLKKKNEIIKIINTETEDGWLYDIQTESKTFATGANLFKIHNSPIRGLEFVTRKITDGVAKIKLGLSDHIELGNLEAERDWGYAGDYVRAMWMMLQQDEPDDYIICTGKTHSIRDFLNEAFANIGITDWTKYIKSNPKYMRPAELHVLRGNSEGIKSKLNWEPKLDFKDLVGLMVKEDIKRLESKHLID